MLTVARDDKAADLDGWVTLANGSGTSFQNAKLQLVAGDLNRVQQRHGRHGGEAMADFAKEQAAAPMAQESFSDYHLYTLGRKTTINNNETKQVSMLSGTGVPVHKRYVVDGQAFYYRNAQHPGSPLKDVVQVYYQFKNEAAAGLGMPMPAGVVRVYQADSKGGMQFVGEDRIDHTPKDETLNLKIGNGVRRRLRAQADRLREDRPLDLRDRVRDHAAQPQGDADHGRGERADRRHLADAELVARLDEDGGLGRAVHRAGRGGRDSDAEVSRARDLLTTTRLAAQ